MPSQTIPDRPRVPQKPPASEGDGAASAQDLPPELVRFEERLARRVAETVRAELANASGPEPLWDVKRVAVRLGVSARTVEALIATGELVPLRIGGQRRFDPRAVEAYVKRCAASNAKPPPSTAPPAQRRARRG